VFIWLFLALIVCLSAFFFSMANNQLISIFPLGWFSFADVTLNSPSFGASNYDETHALYLFKLAQAYKIAHELF